MFIHAQRQVTLALKRITMLLLMAGFGALPGAAQPREADLKAAIIFNFPQFVEWPNEAFRATNAPFVIGVAGSPALEQALTEIARGEKVKGHSIEVRTIRTIPECREAHIVFLGPSESARWREYRSMLRNVPVLTVSDSGQFARRGGMLELFTRDNKVRFRANPSEAKGANLALSSKLLRLAEIVETEGD